MPVQPYKYLQFSCVFGKKVELLHKLELGPHFPGVVSQPPTHYQHKGLEREEITSIPPSVCGLAREEIASLFYQHLSTLEVRSPPSEQTQSAIQ